MIVFFLCFFFFFFSSRRRHTRFDCDWSSDVCSSDLPNRFKYALYDAMKLRKRSATARFRARLTSRCSAPKHSVVSASTRSEERRVGKSVDLGGRRIIKKKKEEIKEIREINKKHGIRN